MDTSALTGIFSIVRRGIKTFVLTMTVFMMVTPLLIATLAYFVASDGSILRGVAAAGIAFSGSAIVGFVAAQKLAAAKVLQEAVAELAMGRKLLGAIFDMASGVSGDNPDGDPKLIQKLQGVSLDEASEVLNAASDGVVERLPGFGLGRLGRGIARRAGRLGSWLTVRVVLRYCATSGEDRDRVDLMAARDKLASMIDEMILDELRSQIFRGVMSVLLIVVAVVLVISAVIRQIPVG